MIRDDTVYIKDEHECRDDLDDFTLDELLLIILGLEPDIPIKGRTFLTKLVFNMWNELKLLGYQIEDPEFYGYKYGPYSDFVLYNLELLWYANKIDIEGTLRERQIYKLTEKGKRKAKELLKLLKKEDVNRLKEIRMGLEQSRLKRGYIKYTYEEWKPYTTKSEAKIETIWDKINEL
ncbi:hypothetical protein HS7_19080 [Sulfolobales archaeon HS-7]|nr:hypothetical protein HS7_19080 [Sulfolobales archaeon HS-7]